METTIFHVILKIHITFESSTGKIREKIDINVPKKGGFLVENFIKVFKFLIFLNLSISPDSH